MGGDQRTGAEVALPKGDVTEGVVRVGDTVRRPHQPQSLAVAGYLDHLERMGFDGAPRYLGRDDRGRDILTFIDGDVPGSPPEAWAADEALLASVGRLVRRLHTASAGYLADTSYAAPAGTTWGRDLVQVPGDPPDDPPELVSHTDVTPQNVVVRDGLASALIDFDLSGPTTRLRDIVNTTWHWVPLGDPVDLTGDWAILDPARRLRILVDAYGLDAGERERFLAVAVDRADRAWHYLRAAADQLGGGWARMRAEGVGDQIVRRQAWVRRESDRLTSALIDGEAAAL